MGAMSGPPKNKMLQEVRMNGNPKKPTRIEVSMLRFFFVKYRFTKAQGRAPGHASTPATMYKLKHSQEKNRRMG